MIVASGIIACSAEQNKCDRPRVQMCVPSNPLSFGIILTINSPAKPQKFLFGHASRILDQVCNLKKESCYYNVSSGLGFWKSYALAEMPSIVLHAEYWEKSMNLFNRGNCFTIGATVIYMLCRMSAEARLYKPCNDCGSITVCSISLMNWSNIPGWP